MPKLKTKKTLRKRINITKKGKLLRKQIETGHLKRKWSTNKKHRKNRRKEIGNVGHVKKYKKMLGI